MREDAERFEPATAGEWSAWLAAHHADPAGVWLVTHKQSSGLAAFDYEEAIVEALRWGWVDSTRRTVDERRTMMWYAARRPGSVWTRRNKLRVAALEAAGRMEPAGAAAVAAARASGMWTLMDDVEDLVVPDDLAAALADRPAARANWDAFPRRRASRRWRGSCSPSGRRRGRRGSPTSPSRAAGASGPAAEPHRTEPASCRAMVPRRATAVTPKPMTSAARTPRLAKAQAPSRPPSCSGPSR